MAPLKPARLLLDFEGLFSSEECRERTVIDLACGDGHNGVYLARKGCRVVLADRSEESLERGRVLASDLAVHVTLWKIDLEKEGLNPLENKEFDGILVFRYLHRPLMPFIRTALKPGGILMYQTYTIEQAQIGKPRNPDHLLQPGELRRWFGDWSVLHYFEGIIPNPKSAIAQIVCRKSEVRGQKSEVRSQRSVVSGNRQTKGGQGLHY